MIVKKLALGVFVVTGLAGCASTETVLSKPATEIYTVDQAPEEVAFCLANKNNTAPMPRADGSTVILVKNGYGGVALSFTVIPDGPEGKQSKVEYRKQFGVIGAAWKQCLGLTD